MAGRLENRVAIVTGAARGIGKGIAGALAAQGATVALWDILDLVEETAKNIKSLGHEAAAFKVDVSDPASVNQIAREVIQKFGKVDILVNDAGIASFIPFLETTNEIRDKIIGTNLYGPWNCAKAILPTMIEHKYGKIINISSVTGPRVSSAGLTAYSASKGGVSGFTRALALEVAEFNITVNAILPGYVDTPMLRGAAADLGMKDEEFVNMLSPTVPLKRLGSPTEVGDLAVFLASDDSKYITGQEIVFDGGNIIQETKGNF
jgi:NAD(P)-dependent dehydrogenase (short-subunit alcohol dehydrogenase family)